MSGKHTPRPELWLGRSFTQCGKGKKTYRYVVADAAPYVRKIDGKPITLFTLESQCRRCRRPFFTKCGQLPRHLKRSCDYCLTKDRIAHRQWLARLEERRAARAELAELLR